MSRVMDIVSTDPMDIVARRAHRAFMRLGKVEEYNPQSFVEGRIRIEGYTAYLTVEWRPHRDGERVRLELSATSNDELSRAADSAMYRFLEAFKAVDVNDLDKKEPALKPKTIALVTAGAVIAAGIIARLLQHPRIGP